MSQLPTKIKTKQKSKRRYMTSPVEVMPTPFEDVKIERSGSPLLRRQLEFFHANKGRLLGGGREVEEGMTEKQIGDNRLKRPSKKDRSHKLSKPNDTEVPKLRAALKKYKVTVCKLMERLKSEQEMY